MIKIAVIFTSCFVRKAPYTLIALCNWKYVIVFLLRVTHYYYVVCWRWVVNQKHSFIT